MAEKNLEIKITNNDKNEKPKFYSIDDKVPLSRPLVETPEGVTFDPEDPELERYRQLWDKGYQKQTPRPWVYLGRIHDSEITE